MKARNALAIAAAVAVVTLALQGCSSTPVSKPTASSTAIDGTGKTLDVLVAANTIYPTQQKQWFTDVSAKFQKLTGATVNFETFASGNDELTRIQTSVVSGQGPDVYSLGTTFTPTAYSTGAFVSLGSKQWAEVGGRDKFVPSLLGISGPNAKDEIGIPLASRPFVVAYNTEMLAAAGIDKPADSWDGLAAQAKKMTTGGQYGMAIAYADGFDPWKFIWGMSLQAGNPLIKNGKASLDNAATLKAYETYFGWMTKDKIVDPAAVGWKNAQAVAAFADGKAAFLPMVSASSKVALDKSSVAGKYAYAVLPVIPPGVTKAPKNSIAAASIISGDNIVVAKYSKNQDLAFALINMLTSPASQKTYFETFGDLPTNAVEAKAVESDKLLAPILVAGSKSVSTPFTGAWGDTQLALVNVVVQSLPELQSGNVAESSLKDKLKTAQTAAQTALDRVH
ncbi:MAG: extracellular solute-binding protein [Pseudolysinimonas sp.]